MTTQVTPRLERDMKPLRVEAPTMQTLRDAHDIRHDSFYSEAEQWAFAEMLLTPSGAGLIPADALCVLIQTLVDERQRAQGDSLTYWMDELTPAIDECQRVYAAHIRTAANVPPAHCGCLYAAVLVVLFCALGLWMALIATGRL